MKAGSRQPALPSRTLRSLTLALALLASAFSHAIAAGEMDMSAAFQRFKFSFFEDPTSAQDALDIPSLAALEGSERRQAETMLLSFLPDARAVIGLGVLRSREAEPRLAEMFDVERNKQLAARDDARMQPGGENEWYPSALLYLAQALWRIDPDPRRVQAIVEVLASARESVFRQEAVEALHDVNDPLAVQALTTALDDGEPLVRYAAARGLLTLHGLPVDPAEPQTMAIRVMSSDAARHDQARREILAAIAGRPAIGR